MNKHLFTAVFLFVAICGSGQTSFNQINTQISGGVDSADYFLQKGLMEKGNGRLMESFKNFEKAIRYDANNKAVVSELATTSYDLKKYNASSEYYKKLVDMGDVTAANYKQLMILSFNLKLKSDVIPYALKLKELDPSEKISYYNGRVHYDDDNYG